MGARRDAAVEGGLGRVGWARRCTLCKRQTECAPSPLLSPYDAVPHRVHPAHQVAKAGVPQQGLGGGGGMGASGEGGALEPVPSQAAFPPASPSPPNPSRLDTIDQGVLAGARRQPRRLGCCRHVLGGAPRPARAPGGLRPIGMCVLGQEGLFDKRGGAAATLGVGRPATWCTPRAVAARQGPKHLRAVRGVAVVRQAVRKFQGLGCLGRGWVGAGWRRRPWHEHVARPYPHFSLALRPPSGSSIATLTANTHLPRPEASGGTRVARRAPADA